VTTSDEILFMKENIEEDVKKNLEEISFSSKLVQKIFLNLPFLKYLDVYQSMFIYALRDFTLAQK